MDRQHDRLLAVVGGPAIIEITIGGYEGFKGYDETRTPEFCRARIATQYANDIDRWISLMNAENDGGYANSWLIGDIKTAEIARYEEGLLYQSLARKTNGYFWGDNTPTDPRIRNLECCGTGFSDIRSPQRSPPGALAAAARRIRRQNRRPGWQTHDQ